MRPLVKGRAPISRLVAWRSTKLTKPLKSGKNIINKDELLSPEVVDQWNSDEFADALRHDQSRDKYNPDFRQFLHVAYKIAAEMSTDYLNALEKYEKIISQNVTKNIYERHIKPIFME